MVRAKRERKSQGGGSGTGCVKLAVSRRREMTAGSFSTKL